MISFLPISCTNQYVQRSVQQSSIMPSHAIYSICRALLFDERRVDTLTCGHVYHHASSKSSKYRFFDISVKISWEFQPRFQHNLTQCRHNLTPYASPYGFKRFRTIDFHSFLIVSYRRNELGNGLCPTCRSPIGQLCRIFVTLEESAEINENQDENNSHARTMIKLFQQLRLRLDTAINTLQRGNSNPISNRSASVSTQSSISTVASTLTSTGSSTGRSSGRATVAPINAISRNLRMEQVINVPLPINQNNRGQNRLHFEIRNGQLMIRILRRYISVDHNLDDPKISQ